MRRLLMLSTAAALSAAGAMNAQNTAAKPDSTCAKYSDGRVVCRAYRRIFMDTAFGSGAFIRMDSVMAKRAALGIELRATGTRRDTLGVFVDGVTPKGPAEAAGIVEGDRIAAINGVDLRTPAGDIDDAYSNGMASHRLAREVQKLTPGSRVTLRVFSNGRFRDVQVVAGKASDLVRFGNDFNFGGPGRVRIMPFGEPGGMMLGPETRMLRNHMVPMMRSPLEQMPNLPRRGQLRAPTRIRALTPPPEPGVYETDEINGISDIDDDEFPDENIPPVTPAEIRELVAAAIRGVAPALKQLAADGAA